MNRRDFCLMLPALFAGCGGNEDDMREIGKIEPSPLKSTGSLNVLVPAYSEVEWTPEVTCSTPGNLSVGYSFRFGRATQIGRMVFVEALIQTNSFTHTTASGEIRFTGLPDRFKLTNASNELQRTGPFAWENGLSKAGYTQFNIRATTGIAYFTALALAQGASTAVLSITDWTTGTTPLFIFNIKYSISLV